MSPSFPNGDGGWQGLSLSTHGDSYVRFHYLSHWLIETLHWLLRTE